MPVYGLIGRPLGHSWSAAWFREKFIRERIADTVYRNFELETIDKLPVLLAAETDLRGFNVTIPYKEAILPYLHELSGEARAVGAVNCVRIEHVTDREHPAGTVCRLIGYNTDYAGFLTSLTNWIGGWRSDALILGTGGASKAVGYALHTLGIKYRHVSRTGRYGALTYRELDAGMLASCRLIVNATPLGTWPDTEAAPPLPYELLDAGHRLYDLVYNPAQTRFMQLGAAQGACTCNGMQMLELQAEASWRIWNGMPAIR